MNLRLAPTDQKLLRSLLRSGRFNSPEEVVRTGLRLIERSQHAAAAKREWLSIAIEEGFESAKREGWIKGDKSFIEGIKAEGRKLAAKRQRRA